MWKDLTEEQKNALVVQNDEMAIKASDDGIARYKKLSEHVALTRPERKIIAEAIQSLEESIENLQAKMLDGAAMPGRPQAWMPAFLSMSSDKLAFATLSCLIHGAHGEPRVLSTVATRLANEIQLTMQLEEIHRLNRVNKDTRGFARTIKDRLSKDSKAIKKLYTKLTSKPLKWNISSKLGLGTSLIQLAVKNTKLFETKLIRDGRKTTYYVMVKPEVNDAINSMEEEIAISRPQRMHMCCPPIPWRLEGNTVVGGYRNMQTEFIRAGFNGNGRHGNNLKNSDISKLLSAINSIQNVEWCIDHSSLEFLEMVVKSNSPTYNSICPVAVERPRIGKTSDMTTQEFKIHRQAYDQKNSEYCAAMSKRIAVLSAISQAKRLKSIPVWFVHSIDFRGRMYPEATNLSPQGTDVGKALLRYAEKKELKAHGLIQLKIWAANCSGNDKISFDDRVKWWDATWGNKPDLEENLSWLSYDSPMLFRQVALEIRYAYASGNPNTYLTSISVCKDGSQNGLQHLSAIGRDEVGGEAVNLINSPIPADLYADVGELVLSSVTGDYEQIMLGDKRIDDFGQPLPPIVWFQRLSTPKIRRSTVKRSVLAYPYGVTKAGMSNGLIEDGLCNGLPGAQNANSWYLAGKIDGSVREVVISAARIMDWFRELAEKAGKKGLSIDWVTPSGFPCRQAYSQKEYKRYELYNMTLAVPQPIPNTIDVKRQVQGIVANIIHSFDCVHAVLTCNAAMANNITSLQFIHDSFGTHACDIDELGVILRNEFISMHSKDLMQQFVDFAKANELDMPPFPSQGKLDLESVRNSAYFFS